MRGLGEPIRFLKIHHSGWTIRVCCYIGLTANLILLQLSANLSLGERENNYLMNTICACYNFFVPKRIGITVFC